METQPNGTKERDMGSEYLEYERRWIFWLLIFVAGWYGAYTSALRSGVFCNVQTANVVFLAMYLARQKWLSTAYLLLPISAYLFGSFLSEWIGKGVKHLHFLRWDTLLVALEMCAVVFLALMPADWPDQICQVTLNFVCAMQFNTYCQIEGLLATTTFVTNHICQIVATLAMLICHPESHDLRRKLKAHVLLFLCFTAGAVVSTVMCGFFSYTSLLSALIPLAAVLICLAWADLLVEHCYFDAVLRGH
jgi:uncharacterized membrane protein YoaK (UPF0700 family)